MQKRWLTRLIAAVGTGVLIGGGVLLPLQAQAAAPAFSGCAVIDDYVRWDSDQTGRWVEAMIKYKCNTGKEFSFEGHIVRVSGSESLGSAGNGGVNTAPWVHVSTFYNCDSTASTAWRAYYQLDINGVVKSYSTPSRTLPCYIRNH
jgi:hypothetical protein